MGKKNIESRVKLIGTFWLVNFLLHLAWENWQILFYEGMAEAPHAQAVWTCTLASFGDANIAFVAYGAAALRARSWTWLNSPGKRPVTTYLLSGISITVVLEYLATEVWQRWAYSEWMPVVPVLGTGLAPILQWVVIPLLSLSATRRLARYR
jgi:hypothetical protein